MQVMKERDESGRLGHIVQVDDAYLGGETPRRQTRTRGAGQDAVSSAAVQVTEEGRPVALRMSCVKGFRKQDIAAWAHRHLQRLRWHSGHSKPCGRGLEEGRPSIAPRLPERTGELGEALSWGFETERGFLAMS